MHPCLAEARHDFVRAQRARIREGLRVDTTNGESRTQPTLKHWRAPSPRFSMGFPHGQVVPPAVGWRSSAQCGACVCHILCHIFLTLLSCVVMFSVCEFFCSALRVAAAEAPVSLFGLLGFQAEGSGLEQSLRSGFRSPKLGSGSAKVIC